MSQFNVENLKNPEFYQDNRLQAHSDHVIYKDEYECLAKKTSYRMYLNGLWKFSYGKNMSLAVSDFESLDYDCKEWDEIRVPAHIQMEGYDAPQYANVQYPCDGREEIEILIIQTQHIHGKQQRKLNQVKYRRNLIRLQAM